MDLNEARLHEENLKIHTGARIFSCLSIASVDCKQHLSEIVFSALVGCLDLSHGQTITEEMC